MMLVEMQRSQFEALNDEELFLICTEPTVTRIRGRNLAVKSEAIAELNRGQQALCMFRVLYPAQHSEADFEAWIAYLLEQPAYWKGVNDGLRFWGETALIQLLEAARETLEAKERETLEEDRAIIQSSIRSLFEKFRSQVQSSLGHICLYIRSHPQEFVQLMA
ncbi:hypothetical protein [Cohnella nanjingensis]|uniref:Uncharacterized protein n=1 Tax=Cohnella nanjingensis TaxID=1387779 RepID=A0A7X0VEP9_9BACL|nr:hypothetical protein [Cohnella nanjingensis]MBB6670478.1 hypothetical protein [Cohnella nanjingensis]